ncbi:hypothetical protein T09_15771 [Trichinella sp. T9]|nr:hypothetical protein T09_15771 [Trichinella sp. T9]
MIITLRQSSSAGAPANSLWIMSSHEARTDPKQCPPGVSMAFTRRPSRCTSQHFVLDSNGLRHQNFCLVAADATLKLRFQRY